MQHHRATADYDIICYCNITYYQGIDTNLNIIANMRRTVWLAVSLVAKCAIAMNDATASYSRSRVCNYRAAMVYLQSRTETIHVNKNSQLSSQNILFPQIIETHELVGPLVQEPLFLAQVLKILANPILLILEDSIYPLILLVCVIEPVQVILVYEIFICAHFFC